jgi:hypothetical protein
MQRSIGSLVEQPALIADLVEVAAGVNLWRERAASVDFLLPLRAAKQIGDTWISCLLCGYREFV